MAPEAHQPVPRAFPGRLHEFEEKGVGQAGKHEQAATMLPVVKPWTLKSEFAFAGTPHLLNLPASGVGKDQGPEVVDAGDRLVGQQIPGQQVVIAATDDQPKGLVSQSRIGMTDGQSEHLEGDGSLVNGIPSWSLLPSTQVSGELPWTLLVSVEITEVIVGFPAQHKTQLGLYQDQQPRQAGKPPVKNVQQE